MAYAQWVASTGTWMLGLAWLHVAHKAETKRAAELARIVARVRSLDKAD